MSYQARTSPSATIYGPAPSRSRVLDASQTQSAQPVIDGYDYNHYPPVPVEEARKIEEQVRAQQEAQSQQFQHTSGHVSFSPSSTQGRRTRPAFYNTREGEEWLQKTRSELARTGQAVASSPSPSSASVAPSGAMSEMHTASTSQRYFHSQCVLPDYITKQAAPSTNAEYLPYPIQEYNRSGAGPDVIGSTTGVRVKSVVHSPHQDRDSLSHQVLVRHDMVANIRKKESTSNYEHSRNFIAKHTNNLVTC